ncbi:MAG: ankyrin repeat domain-containing protein [Pseudomonadota bacterium]
MGPHAASNTSTAYQTVIHTPKYSSKSETKDNKLPIKLADMKQVINHTISLKNINSKNIIDIHDNLSSAIKNGNIDKFRFWISKFSESTELSSVNRSIDLFTGHTALHLAALYRQKLMIHLLKQKEALLTVLDRDNRTPLDLAIAAHPDDKELQNSLQPHIKCQSILHSIFE